MAIIEPNLDLFLDNTRPSLVRRRRRMVWQTTCWTLLSRGCSRHGEAGIENSRYSWTGRDAGL